MAPAQDINDIEEPNIEETSSTTKEIDDDVPIPEDLNPMEPPNEILQTINGNEIAEGLEVIPLTVPDPMKPSNEISPPLYENEIPEGPDRFNEIDDGSILLDPFNELGPKDATAVDPRNNPTDQTNLNINKGTKKGENNSVELNTNLDIVKNSIEGHNVSLEDDESYLKVIPLTIPDPIEPSNEISPPLNENEIPEGPDRFDDIDDGIVLDPIKQLGEEIITTSDHTELDPYNETGPSDSTTVDPRNNPSNESLNTNNEAEKGDNSERDTKLDKIQNSNKSVEDDESSLKVIALVVSIIIASIISLYYY